MRRRAPFTTTELWRAASTGTTQVGDAGFCQPRAILDDLVKGEIGHQAGTQGQQDSAQQEDIELSGDPNAEPAALVRCLSC